MTPLPVRMRPAAERDLDEIVHYLAREAGVEVALRFEAAVKGAFERIATHPEIGAVHDSPAAQLADIRRWAVPGFWSYLLFYEFRDDSVDVIRVLHGARDLDSILPDEI